MSTPPVRFGILSTAAINQWLLPGFHATSEAEIVAVASRSLEKAEAFARDEGIGRAYGSYEELLADDEVEAIYNPLPNSMHVDWSVRALEAGKHVLCEKPIDRRPAEVERLFDAAERADRVVMEAFMYRHHPQTKQLAELVADGTIGELRLIRSTFGFRLLDEQDIRMRPELDGGGLMDVGCYCVSVSRFLAGEPETVFARQVLTNTGVDGRIAAILTFPNGAFASFECGLDVSEMATLEIVGSEARLLVDDPFHVKNPGITVVRGDESERLPAPSPNPEKYRLQIENFSRAVRGEEEPLLGRADAVGQARVIEAVYRSADEGAPVSLSR